MCSESSKKCASVYEHEQNAQAGPSRPFARAQNTSARTAAATYSAEAAVSSGNDVEQPICYKANIDLARSMRHGVSASRKWWDRAEANAAAGLPTPDSVLSLSPSPGTASSISDGHEQNAGVDPVDLATRLAHMHATCLASGAASSSIGDAPVYPAPPTSPPKPRRGRPSPPPSAQAQKLKRRRSASHNNGQSRPKESKNAQRKRARRAAAAAGDGEWHGRDRKRQGQQTASSRRRFHRRVEERDRINATPWSARSRGAFYERQRQFRYILLDENQDVKLSVSQQGAYVGSYGQDWGAGCAVSEDDAIAAGLKKVPYDASDTLLLLNDQDIICGVFAPPPKPKAPRPSPSASSPAEGMNNSGPSFEEPATFGEMCDEIVELFDEAKDLNLPTGGRRGPFEAVNIGLQSGMSHPPHTLAKPAGGEEFVDKLTESPALNRLAEWQSELFAYWAPLAYHHTRCKLQRLHKETGLRPPFPRSVYPTACANCGSHTVCAAHRDKTNYPTCLCGITALGDYDAENGGHMALPELGIYVPFPAGTTCLISSAAMAHGNIDIGKDETRYSFTQYCVGGLIRWVSYGFQPVKNLSDAQRAEMDELEKEGWEAQYARLSNVWEVDDHRQWVREQELLELENDAA